MEVATSDLVEAGADRAQEGPEGEVLASLTKGNDDVLKTWPGIEKDNSIFVPIRVIAKDNVAEFEAEVKKILGK